MLTKKHVLLHGVFDKKFFEILNQRGIKNVVVLEGRPSLAAAKVMTRDLLKKKIMPTLIADNMAGFLFYKDLVKEVWVTYEAIHKTGALCDIGALILSVLGKQHKVDVNLFRSRNKARVTGRPKEILEFNGKRIAPQGIKAYVPLVEFVPQKYITGIWG